MENKQMMEKPIRKWEKNKEEEEDKVLKDRERSDYSLKWKGRNLS